MRRFFLLLFFVILGLCLTSGSNTAHAQPCGPYCTPNGFSCGGNPACCCTGVCDAGGGSFCGPADPPTPTPAPPPMPYVESLTINPNPIWANNSTQHTIRIVTVDPNQGGPFVTTQYAHLNLYYPNAVPMDSSLHRGYLGWSIGNFPWWCGVASCGAPTNYAPGSLIGCTGGGFAAKYIANGAEYINLLGCSTSTNGLRRTTDFIVSFPITFQSLASGNTLSGWTQSDTGAWGWGIFQQFDAYINPLVQNVTISSPTVNANGSNLYTVTMTAYDGNGGADIQDQHTIIDLMHPTGTRGTIGWSNRGFPWWGTSLRGTVNCTSGGGR